MKMLMNTFTLEAVKLENNPFKIDKVIKNKSKIVTKCLISPILTWEMNLERRKEKNI